MKYAKLTSKNSHEARNLDMTGKFILIKFELYLGLLIILRK
jgi:hypothetical protein